MVAIKIIRNKKRFHTQALVEVKILMHIKTHDQDDSANFVQTRGHFYFRSHLCIAFELLSMNLYEFIKNNNFQGISLPLIRRFAIQLLTSLRALRKQRIVHCDLKPENILLKEPGKSAIKMIDFGSSCFEETKVLHPHYTHATPTPYLHPELTLTLTLTLTLSRSTPTSRAASTAAPRSYWVCPTTARSTCGRSVASSQSSSQATLSSQARTRWSSSRASWRCSVCRLASWWGSAADARLSLTRRATLGLYPTPVVRGSGLQR